jgi:superfamily II DNA or RNA helicase
MKSVARFVLQAIYNRMLAEGPSKNIKLYVVIDEAHKCSARTQGDELRRSGRYRLAEELSQNTERILLLTATPHQGNPDQFHNFLRLLDPDQFISKQINPQQ